jgi:hypothetical protein
MISNFERKKIQSYELTSFLVDKLKSWVYDDADDENNNMVQCCNVGWKNHRFDYMLS